MEYEGFKELTDEQKAKARACATTDELVELARQEGIDLTDEQLQAISGGDVMADWFCVSYTCSTDGLS